MTMVVKAPKPASTGQIPMPNHFKVPCGMITELSSLRLDEVKVFLALCHKHSAFFLQRAVMSITSLEKTTGLRRCDVETAVWSLKHREWIKEVKSPKGKLLGYELRYE